MRLLLILFITALSGCMAMGVQDMTPAQIKATEGMLTCTQLQGAYGRGVAVSVNMDDVRKGMTSKGRIIVTADCAITIYSDVGTATIAPAP